MAGPQDQPCPACSYVWHKILMANAGINAAVGQEESFMVAFIFFQTSLDAAFVKKPSGVGSGQRSWSTKTRLSLPGKKN